jgi:hypothetical protein
MCWLQGIRVSGNLILPGEPLAKGYYPLSDLNAFKLSQLYALSLLSISYTKKSPKMKDCSADKSFSHVWMDSKGGSSSSFCCTDAEFFAETVGSSSLSLAKILNCHCERSCPTICALVAMLIFTFKSLESSLSFFTLSQIIPPAAPYDPLNAVASISP